MGQLRCRFNQMVELEDRLAKRQMAYAERQKAKTWTQARRALRRAEEAETGARISEWLRHRH
jgi:hypothetical protein